MVMGTEMSEFHTNQLFSSNKLVTPQPFNQQDQFLDIPFPFPSENNLVSSSNSSPDGDSHDDSEIFSDIALNYISQMLMDEDDKVDNFHEYSAIEATEKNLYEIINPSSSDSPNSSSGTSGGAASSSNSNEYSEYHQFPIEFHSEPSFGIHNYSSNDVDGLPDLFLESLPAWSFNKGVEEARKFLPSDDKLVIDLEGSSGLSLPSSQPKQDKFVEVKPEKEEKEYEYTFGSRGRKHPHMDDDDDDAGLGEGRCMKQSAVSFDEALRSKEFDEVLLCHGDKFPESIEEIREGLQHAAASKNSQNGNAKGRGKRQQKKEEVVDLRTLLVHCAQMVAQDDQRSTNELLKQIRQHSSPTGDGSQRLAHYFADGLEARLAGTGSEKYNSYRAKRRTATDFLKAFQLYLAACPFKKISHFFSNQTILNVAEKAARIHVIDFGINFGFQWPSLIQRLSSVRTATGVPKLRITGIDVPQPGFRPAERIEETGRRLHDYAQSFGVPFEYKAIASKFEDVRAEQLDIDRGEVLVVHCMFQFKHLADETVAVDSPRNMVLNNIRKMNPDVFIHGIVNGAYSAPFFVTRFREALYHFSALYDMLETIVPREDDQRLLIEREIFAWEALNVIACEGLERTERPETYKQWQVRNLRAGFVQHHLSQEIMKKARDKVKKFYHKDFNVDEDSRWLLLGWKGRIIYALSSWKPNHH